MLRPAIKFAQILWASPNSLIGLFVGTAGFLFGTRVQVRRGCLEFFGGPVTMLLRRVPLGGSTAAMTLGHTILGQDPADLDRCRDHEHVHVRQYERWGPFFLPAYVGWAVWLWLQNKDAYFDNPFEVEAYLVADPRSSASGEDRDELA
jgi:hypothetical protein